MPYLRNCGAAMRKEAIFSPAVLGSKAYAVAEVPADMLKLDAMEAPQDFPAHLREAWLRTLADVPLNRYPPARDLVLQAQLRRIFGIDDDYGLLLGNGSDELIQILLMALRKDAVVLAPAPTFVMYRIVCDWLGLRYRSIDVLPDFSLDIPAMLAAIAQEQPALIFLAQPNNPTGKAYPEADIRRIAEAAQGLVVIDEAYLAFSEGSMQALLAKYDNLLILRTLSKTGFAGLRFGYLFGAREWTAQLDKVRPPYNVNVLTQASILFVLQHYEEIAAQAALIKQERAAFCTALDGLRHCRYWSSQANFVVLRTPNADAWFAQLKERGILVKNLHGAHPLLADCLRLTISQAQDNRLLFKALEELDAQQ